MHRTNLTILAALLFFINCKSDKDPSVPGTGVDLKDNALTGYYDGYKRFNKSRTDSVAVSLQVSRDAENKWVVTEITPFAHKISVDLNGLNFTYDRGVGEDDCGSTRMTGNGYFKGRQVYFIETTKCSNPNFPDEYVEYRAAKK